jgi:hypothetical protein
MFVRPWRYLLVAGASLGAALGFWRAAQPQRVPKTIRLNWAVDEQRSSEARGTSTRAQTHDFGVVRPHQSLKHVFRIRNDSSGPWRITSVSRTCACTTSRISTDVIERGDEAEVEVDYHTSSEPTDERRVITVQISQALPWDEITYELTVTARVRNALTIVPTSLHIPSVGQGGASRQLIEIGNYGGRDWTSIVAEPSANWLTAELRPRDVMRNPRDARQLWQAILTIDAPRLMPGMHRAGVRFRARGGGDETMLDYPISVVGGVVGGGGSVGAILRTDSGWRRLE